MSGVVTQPSGFERLQNKDLKPPPPSLRPYHPVPTVAVLGNPQRRSRSVYL